MNTHVAILGAGNLGTALAAVVGGNGIAVRLWNRPEEPEPLDAIDASRENSIYLPGIPLPETVYTARTFEEAMQGADIVFLAIPSHSVCRVYDAAKAHIPAGIPVVNCAKGFDGDGVLTGQAIVCLQRDASVHPHVALAGPAIAGQMAAGKPTTLVAAGEDVQARDAVAAALRCDYIGVETTADVIGVEVASAAKNIYAILSGMCDASGAAMNTKSALLTLGMQEIAALIDAMGGQRETVYTLAGLGDILTTAFSAESRNYRFGTCIGGGTEKNAACKEIGQVVEGIAACDHIHKLVMTHKIHAPIISCVYDIVHDAHDVRERLDRLYMDVVQSLS